MMVVLPKGAGLDATQEAMGQLLHNPLGPHALPLVAQQWRHDVDQLFITAINTPPHGGGQVNHLGRAPVLSVAHSHSPAAYSCSVAAPLVSSAVRAASLTMMDLWAELERRCSGIDGRITIECQRERCRNLNGDLSAVDTTPLRQAACTPTSAMGSGGGYVALAPHLHMVVWLHKF
jgi:hypothetical protein